MTVNVICLNQRSNNVKNSIPKLFGVKVVTNHHLFLKFTKYCLKIKIDR